MATWQQGAAAAAERAPGGNGGSSRGSSVCSSYCSHAVTSTGACALRFGTNPAAMEPATWQLGHGVTQQQQHGQQQRLSEYPGGDGSSDRSRRSRNGVAQQCASRDSWACVTVWWRGRPADGKLVVVGATRYGERDPWSRCCLDGGLKGTRV